MEQTKDAEKIREIQKSAQPCFQCGICAASCPVFRVAPEFNPRIAVDEVIRTGSVEVTGREWSCAYCLMCEERCPMGVALCEILMDIKNLSSPLTFPYPRNNRRKFLGVSIHATARVPPYAFRTAASNTV